MRSCVSVAPLRSDVPEIVLLVDVCDRLIAVYTRSQWRTPVQVIITVIFQISSYVMSLEKAEIPFPFRDMLEWTITELQEAKRRLRPEVIVHTPCRWSQSIRDGALSLPILSVGTHLSTKRRQWKNLPPTLPGAATDEAQGTCELLEYRRCRL